MESIFKELNKIDDSISIRESRKIFGESIEPQKITEETNYQKLVKAFPELELDTEEFSDNISLTEATGAEKLNGITNAIKQTIDKTGWTKRSVENGERNIVIETRSGKKDTYTIETETVTKYILLDPVGERVCEVVNDKKKFIEEAATIIVSDTENI